jgi:hypothetical protein
VNNYSVLDVLMLLGWHQSLILFNLNLAQIENRSLKLNKQRFDLSALITNILKDYRNQLLGCTAIILAMSILALHL